MKIRSRKPKISFIFCVTLITCLGLSIATSTIPDPNCQTFNSKGKCTQCNNGYYFNNTSKLCTKVSYLCGTWNQTSGECLTCFPGYGDPVQGVCSSTPQTGCDNVNIVDLNCQCYNDDKVCITCYSGYYLDSNNFCVEGDDSNCNHCIQYSYLDSKGNSYSSYKSGCQLVCSQCEKGYYLDCKHKCQELPENCEAVNQAGACTDCNDGYEFDSNGDCVLVNENCEDNCAEYWWVNPKGKFYSNWISGCKKVCKTCNTGYYLNCNNDCIQYPPYCTSVDDNGVCTGCSLGYKLDCNSDCVPLISSTSDDHCSSYWYMNSNGNYFNKWILGCKKICKECDDGYYLDCNKTCQELPLDCVQADSDGKCNKCSDNYQIDQNGYCIPVPGGPSDDHCSVYQYKDSTGKYYSKWSYGCKRICKTCDLGYSIENDGTCVLGSDPLCVTTNQDGTCAVCSYRSVLGCLGRCIAVNAQCATWDNSTALCTSCYGGYRLVNGCCVVA